MPDFIAETIEYSHCKYCKAYTRYQWKEGEWCVGLMKKNTNRPPCDVIRFCDRDMKGYDFSPDEAFVLSYMLTKVANWWLTDHDKYFEFKIGMTKKEYNIKERQLL